MTARTLPTTRTTTQEGMRERLQLPANRLIGVINRASALAPLQSALAFAGITADQVDILEGEDGRQRLEGVYTGVVGRIRRWAHGLGLGPEAAIARQHRQELESGNLLVAIRNVDRDLVEKVRDILITHNARSLQHYGRFSIAFLTP